MDFAFDSLPSGLQKKILEAAAGKTSKKTVVARLENRGRAYGLATLVTLLALGIAALLAISPLDVPLPPKVVPVGALVAAALVGFAAFLLGPVLATRRSKLKPLALATSDFVVVVRRDGDSVTVRKLRDLRNAYVASNWLELRFADETLLLPLADKVEGPKLVYHLQDAKEKVERYPSEAEEELTRLEESGVAVGAGARGGRPGLRGVATFAVAAAAVVAVSWAVGVRLHESRAFALALAGHGTREAQVYRAFASRSRAALGGWARLAPFVEHDAEAHDLEDDREFEQAKSAAQLQSYIGHFSRGRHLDEARPLEDDAAFREAAAAKGFVALGSYAEGHGRGKHVAEADDAFFERARGSPAGLDRYRSVFPRGRHQPEVAAARSALFEETATRFESLSTVPGAKRIAALLRFLARNADSVLRISVQEESPGGFQEAARAAAQATPGLQQPGKELEPAQVRKKETRLREELATCFAGAFPEGLVRVTQGDVKSGDPSVLALDVRYKIVSSGAVKHVEKKTTQLPGAGDPKSTLSHEDYLSLQVTANVELRIPGEPTTPLALEGQVSGEYTVLSGGIFTGVGDDTVYAMQLSVSLDSLRRTILGAYGLPKDEPPKR